MIAFCQHVWTSVYSRLMRRRFEQLDMRLPEDGADLARNACENLMWRDMYSAFGKLLCTYKSCWKSIERTIVSKNVIKLLNTLQILHFKHCLTTEYSETTAHFNGNFDTDNQIFVP
jgi:hypothetical protein